MEFNYRNAWILNSKDTCYRKEKSILSLNYNSKLFYNQNILTNKIKLSKKSKLTIIASQFLANINITN